MRARHPTPCTTLAHGNLRSCNLARSSSRLRAISVPASRLRCGRLQKRAQTAVSAQDPKSALAMDATDTTVLRVHYMRLDGQCQVRIQLLVMIMCTLRDHTGTGFVGNFDGLRAARVLSWCVSHCCVQGWKLHAWGTGVLHHTSWDKPLPATGCASRLHSGLVSFVGNCFATGSMCQQFGCPSKQASAARHGLCACLRLL